jgi:hypothetical protein
MNHIIPKTYFILFNMDWTRFRHAFNSFSLFIVSFCLFLLYAQILYQNLSRENQHYKPNPKGILSQCRYTDT